ncbi:MAG: M48 family metallopeptidase [Bacteroidia bacterium]
MLLYLSWRERPLVYWAVMYNMVYVNKLTILLKLGAIAMAGMFFVFVIKFIFKKHAGLDPSYVEINESEQPDLFAFVRKLSGELGAPFPKKIFVNHQINAAVFYNSTILSLFLPVRKNLIIGLGLVNATNLTEIKAILAHEFGHFSQRSMKLGSYTYMANSIIHSMVYERDRWDLLLEQWKRSDIRISVFAWLLMPLVWLVRQLMTLVFRGINLIHSALSRQMEFHADRVAVSAAGSNAIVYSLYKLNLASEAESFAFQHINTAVEHGLVTDDIFYHQSKAYEFLSNSRPEFQSRLLENRHDRETQLFDPNEVNMIQMYASHPANYLREQRAREIFIEGTEDLRPAWVLFREAEALKKRVTAKLLELSGVNTDKGLTPAADVQAFIERELSETEYDARYHGIYDGRYLFEPTQTETAIQEQLEQGDFAERLATLYQQKAPAQGQELKTHNEQMGLLYGIATGQDRRKEFEMEGQRYKASEAVSLFEQKRDTRQKAFDAWYEEFDREVYVLHAALARKYPEFQEEFDRRYSFHFSFQKRIKNIQTILADVHGTIDRLNQESELTEEGFEGYGNSFAHYQEKFLKEIDLLKNLAGASTGKPGRRNFLIDFLVPNQVKTIGPRYPADMLSAQINDFVNQISQSTAAERGCISRALGLF